VEYFGMEDAKNTVGNSSGLYTKSMDFHQAGIERFLYPLHIIYSFEAKRKLGEVIRRFRPDIIHFNNINFQLTPSVIEAGAAYGVPMVQTVHDLQMLCPNHLMLDIRNMKPCELCLHGSAIHCVKNNCIHHSRLKSLIGTLEGSLYRHRNTYDKISTYICPSAFIEGMLLKKKRYQGKTVMLRNFLGELPDAAGEKRGDYVLFFGRLSEEKGIDDFLTACAKIPEIPVVIAGDGPLKEACRSCGLSNVTYVGFKTGEDLRNLVQNAAFTVHFSVWYENSPLAILESEALGTPVLCNRIGGIPELVEDGKTGILNDDFSPKGYADQIRRLYGQKELLLELSRNCLKKRNTMMTLERYVEALLTIYEDAIEMRRND
jgi:glycosyltransferase involved in cell wall biosynthesis